MVVKALERQINSLITYMDGLDKSSKEYNVAVVSLTRLTKSYEELVSSAHQREVDEAKLFLEQEKQESEDEIKLAKLHIEERQYEDARLAEQIARKYESNKDRIAMRDERIKYAVRLVADAAMMAANQRWLSGEFEKGYYFEEHGTPCAKTTSMVQKQLPLLMKK